MQGLKALVIFLGVLIVIAASAVGVTIYKRATGKLEKAPAAAAKHAFGKKTVALPQGAHLDDVATGGGRLILQIRLADGSPRILILDLDSGEQLGEIDFAPSGAPASR